MSLKKRSHSEVSISLESTSSHPNVRRRIDLPDATRIPAVTLPLTLPNTPGHSATRTVSPPFQQPLQLLSFSYTSKPSPDNHAERIKTLEWNNASMRYYVPPPPGADLSRGYERWIKRPEERGRLDGLLEACVRDECEGERRRADVITWRGVGTKILTAPYEDRDGWELNVMVVGGTIYLEEHLTDSKLFEKSNMSGKQRLMTYYGYAFESYCTSDTLPALPSSPPRPENGWSGDVDTNVQWCSVVKTKLGAFRMIFGGEVDCVKDHNMGRPDTFVELKTSVAIRPGNQNDTIRFEKKLLKFYFQSFLLGVPEIIVGFRTPSGYLQTLQSFKTMDLPRTVRGKPGAWDPATCLTWGEKVISFLRHETRDNSEAERTVWRITFTPGVGLSMRRLDADEVADVVAGEDRVGFLPRWYWQRVLSDAHQSVPTVTQGANTEDGGRVSPESHSDPPITGQLCMEKQTLKGWQI